MRQCRSMKRCRLGRSCGMACLVPAVRSGDRFRPVTVVAPTIGCPEHRTFGRL
jgi:hypothetical protein